VLLIILMDPVLPAAVEIFKVVPSAWSLALAAQPLVQVEHVLAAPRDTPFLAACVLRFSASIHTARPSLAQSAPAV
jgi:hypothetical protein